MQYGVTVKYYLHWRQIECDMYHLQETLVMIVERGDVSFYIESELRAWEYKLDGLRAWEYELKDVCEAGDRKLPMYVRWAH